MFVKILRYVPTSHINSEIKKYRNLPQEKEEEEISENIPKNCILKNKSSLATQATIYLIWKEKNNRLHNFHYSSAEAVFIQIDRMIRDTPC